MADITDLIFEDHQWFRRQFFYLDEAKTVEEMTAIWEPLATRLDTHADAEERIFYPALLKKSDDPDDETEDAIGDHNKIRDASPRHADTRSTARAGGRPSTTRARRTASTSRRRSARGCPTSAAARRPHEAQAGDGVAALQLRAPARPRGRRPGQGPRGVRRGALLAQSLSSDGRRVRGRPARPGACAAPR